jgi:hypothetical protein
MAAGCHLLVFKQNVKLSNKTSPGATLPGCRVKDSRIGRGMISIETLPLDLTGLAGSRAIFGRVVYDDTEGSAES